MNAPEPARKLRILREMAAGRGGQVVLIAVLSVASTGATLALPMLVGKLIAAIQQGHGLTLWALAMVGVGLGTAVSGAVAAYLLSRMGQRLLCRLRIRTMDHALRLPTSNVREEGPGGMVARVTADAARLKAVIDIGPIQLPMAGATVIGTLIIMGIMDWVLLLITVAAFLVAAGVVVAVVKGLRRKYAIVGEEVGALAQHFAAAVQAVTIIKAYRAERTVAGELARSAERVAGHEIDAARMESLMVPVINLGQQIALVSVVIGGGARMIDGHLSLSDFVAFLLYLLQLTAPLIMAASGVNGLQVGLVARQRFDDFFALPREAGGPAGESVPRPATGHDAPEGTPAVRFDKVSFSYGPTPVLRETDLVVPGRGLTAMVGLSGSGKTTALGLIERFVTEDSGSVRIFGREAADWPLDELRGRMAYVDQASTLLQDTVRSNLQLGQDTALPDESLYEALEKVGLADEIRRLPDGLETVLGGANDLSGGQRQRLALARAVLSDARLVLLDEPSSQLDSINEQKLRDVVDTLAAGRAVLVVAHRISTVQHADHVIVLDGGRLVGQGTHDELLRDCPNYADLVSGQMLSAVPGLPASPPAGTPVPATA
ncbi:ABC transporter ATP-binding protein [Kitasatospora sp. HPMI-4]|uniref:ABC transporter ATP-binding protein n=1 Tax=Kitasatospora sp. HPMI-4 TaxID=3448443 RepID=UPI003F1E155A